MATLPSKSDANKKATAVAKKPLVVPEYLAEQVTRAINAGHMYVELHVKADVNQVEAAFKALGYDCKWITTGPNESSLQVSWA